MPVFHTRGATSVEISDHAINVHERPTFVKTGKLQRFDVKTDAGKLAKLLPATHQTQAGHPVELENARDWATRRRPTCRIEAGQDLSAFQIQAVIMGELKKVTDHLPYYTGYAWEHNEKGTVDSLEKAAGQSCLEGLDLVYSAFEKYPEVVRAIPNLPEFCDNVIAKLDLVEKDLRKWVGRSQDTTLALRTEPTTKDIARHMSRVITKTIDQANEIIRPPYPLTGEKHRDFLPQVDPTGVRPQPE